MRSDDGSDDDEGDYSLASTTMSIQSADDLPPDAPRCLRCFPTGSECMRFYIVAFVSAMIIIVGAIYILMRPDDTTGRCVFTGLMTTVMSFWIQPPSIGVVRRRARVGARGA